MKPVARVTDLEAAYWAGIIDGEGTMGISYRKKHHSHALTLRIINVSKPLVQKAIDTFGVGYTTTVRPRKMQHRTLYGWNVCDNEAAAVLSKLVPFMLVKREHALIALAFRERMRLFNFSGKHDIPMGEYAIREEFRRQLGLLNHRGLSLDLGGLGEKNA